MMKKANWTWMFLGGFAVMSIGNLFDTLYLMILGIFITAAATAFQYFDTTGIIERRQKARDDKQREELRYANLERR